MRATLRALLAGTVSAAVLSAAGPAAAAPPAVADGVYVGECCGGAYYSGHVMVAGLEWPPMAGICAPGPTWAATKTAISRSFGPAGAGEFIPTGRSHGALAAQV
jgi:hypothetical protein